MANFVGKYHLYQIVAILYARKVECTRKTHESRHYSSNCLTGEPEDNKGYGDCKLIPYLEIANSYQIFFDFKKSNISLNSFIIRVRKSLFLDFHRLISFCK